MRRFTYKRYLVFGVVLFTLLSLPTSFVQRSRQAFFSLLSPFFKQSNALVREKPDVRGQLEVENHQLRNEINKLRSLIQQNAKAQQLEELSRKLALTPRKYEELKFLADTSRQAIAASVIYRDPGSWSSSLWVNVGEQTNVLVKREIIKKNSPVIVGCSVVGAIDYVGKTQSRVRLITDVALKPSVRAARGFAQNIALLEHLNPLLRYVAAQGANSKKWTALVKELEKLKGELSVDAEGWYLAKGIIQGQGTPIWRSANQILSGTGFNFDFADQEGEARELISGKVACDERSERLPIIQVNDLLVTTGMDGVFPRGLHVATVTTIHPLREGAYTYEIEAVPVVGNLDNLQTVFIIPPIGFEQGEY